MSNWPQATLVAAAVSATLAIPGGARAQTVLGRVLERGGGGPVPGAMVRLRSGDDATGAGWLTTADGRFRLRAPAGGTYELHVERIGFASTVVGGVTVAEDGIASIDLVVEARPVALEELVVAADGGQCQPAAADAGAAQVVWDEARKALSAASWTRSRADLRFLVSAWDRQVSTRTSQILHEEASQRETIGANSVQSLPPERLLAEGYVQRDVAYTHYYAPDAEALLSDEFQGSHCFRLVKPKDALPYVGLAFEPYEGRDLPDVAGTIWLDRLSGRLDRVEFRYTGLDVPGASRARGEVRFAELANGQWIVREWFIQAPMGAAPVGMPGALRRAGQSLVHEVGNAVDLVEGEGLVWRPDVAPGVVRGVVFDSIAGSPLAGAVVRVGGRSLRARAGPEGRFELRGVGPGLHRITFEHPRLDSLGVTAGWLTVEMTPAGIAEVVLSVPPGTTALTPVAAGEAPGEESTGVDSGDPGSEGRSPVLERVGFYERAATYRGAFIRPDHGAAASPPRTSDLLGRVPGVRVTAETRGGTIRRRVLFNRVALLEGDLCYPALFIDGQLMRVGGSRSESQWPAIQGVAPAAAEDVPSVDDLVPPHDVVAVEMYENPARLPGRFIGLGTRCGVIAIWTPRAR